MKHLTLHQQLPYLTPADCKVLHRAVMACLPPKKTNTEDANYYAYNRAIAKAAYNLTQLLLGEQINE